LAAHGLAPRKSWGQNFLHAPGIHAAIVEAVGAADAIVEIGAGLGTLTTRLLAGGARVHAIERDRDLCAVLRTELGAQERLTLHEADAVTFDYAAVAGRPTIVGNLPYHLTGPLLFRLLEFDAATGPWIVMVQKEVGDRLRAAPGSRTYGAATVSLGRVREIRRVIAVPRGAFLPPPRVDSVVLALLPRAVPRGEVPDPRAFPGFVRAIFQQRRKTLANALARLAADRDEALAWCRRAGVDPRVRPEQLECEAFAALARARGVTAVEGDGR
jgi:16S rRNA (adenine1518-N6/adenine1519-N6)-dimethyltransferase